MRSHLATIIYPVQLIASFPSDIGDWTSEYFQSRRELKEQNDSFKATQLLNAVRLQRLQALERENMRLHRLLGSSFRLPERVLVAELLTIDSDPFSQQIVINRGNQYDIFEGQPVLDASGVMGQVMSVSRFSSRVILLTDPSHAIPVQVNRNGVRSIVTGRGLAEPLQLEHLPYNADVRVGDSLVTSGLGGRFPVGYPVGTISAITRPAGKPFANIKVAPAADLSTSREVLLVLPRVDEIDMA
ncbi:MAG: rod shape-determining protein MreC, partial [Methylophagaceae bacterium]